MYCNKCGKEVTENVSFCTHCGAKLEYIPKKTPEKSRNIPTNKISISKSIGFLPIILIAILGILFVTTAISHWQGNVNAFDWTSSFAKVVGMILHWGIMCIFLGICVECIFNFLGRGMKGEILINNSIILFVFAMLYQIGHWIFNVWKFGNMQIIMYRIFSTYTDLIGVSVFFAIIMFVVGILLLRVNNAEK